MTANTSINSEDYSAADLSKGDGIFACPRKDSLKFRQIHLDFHTSGAIDGVGSHFDKRSFQETLKRAEVDSVTCFATCHHGWSYYDTKVGTRHPGLSFDLLRAQFDACKEIGIHVPIYLTAGVNNLAAESHPEWRAVNPEGGFSGWCQNDLTPGFKMLSFFSPYLDHLCDQMQEVLELFPDADGLFFDIINQSEDCSSWALDHMRARGMDPLKLEDRRQSRYDALIRYYKQVTEMAYRIDPKMPIFHNSGHITPGFREILPYFSHLELESLPTGGWGYDHFPMSAKYAHKLGMEYLGMTGKFHTTWGEFGGYKHPNALKYECSAMLAYGARCSIGDQLHPFGQLDESAYHIIGEAYREVARKEVFVIGAENVADVAVLFSESTWAEKSFRERCREHPADIGATRVLLEEHLLFDAIDPWMDFSPYRLLVLPDDVVIDSALEHKLKSYLAEGGKLVLSGESGIDPERGMLFDIGAEIGERSQYEPDYLLPEADLRPDFIYEPMVMYAGSRRVKVNEGQSLGDVYDPFFNRTWDHFCGHQHTPACPEPSGYACGVRHKNVLYFAHPVFRLYRSSGSVALRHYIAKAMRSILAADERLQLANLPSTGRVTLTHQAEQRRYILHLLYANTINRGGAAELHGGNTSGAQQSYEVIEELVTLHDIAVRLRLDQIPKRVKLEPAGTEIEFSCRGDEVRLTLPRLHCHQMIVFDY